MNSSVEAQKEFISFVLTFPPLSESTVSTSAKYSTGSHPPYLVGPLLFVDKVLSDIMAILVLGATAPCVLDP